MKPLFPADGSLDSLVVERVRVCYAQMNSHVRELEAYKLKRGYCVAGISCTRKGAPGPNGAPGRACAYHLAARKAGKRLARWAPYESEYGRLRKEQREEERERERAEEERKKKIPKAPRSKRAAA